MIYNFPSPRIFSRNITHQQYINRSNRKGLQMIEKYNIVTIGSLQFIYCSWGTFRRTVLIPSESEILIFSSLVNASSLSTTFLTFFCPPGFGGGQTSSNGGSMYFLFDFIVTSCLPQSVPPIWSEDKMHFGGESVSMRGRL